MVAVPVCSVRRVVCASPSLLDSVGRPGHPDKLDTLSCILFTGLSAPDGWRFQENQRRFTVGVSGSFSCNHLGAARDACAEGLGFWRFFSYQVAPMREAGTPVAVLEEYEPAPLPVSLVYPVSRLVPARQHLLIAWLKDALADQQAVKSELFSSTQSPCNLAPAVDLSPAPH